ncbi:MAG: GNAT family N-acetyltransferase [Pirellulales bacterium]|nr:GNAT family N-acetyltransferase [Pirellulales bacterium]
MVNEVRSLESPSPVAGYASARYAASLSEFGTARQLPGCHGWLLETTVDSKMVPGTVWHDAAGCYPLFCCADWDRLQDDIESLPPTLVSVRVVTDPFAATTPEQLRASFPDVCREFKQHFITDLSAPLERAVSKHHQRNVAHSLELVDVRISTDGNELLAVWCRLYDNLIERHGITGIARFSTRSFAEQLQVPGLVAFCAYERGPLHAPPCGMTLWYLDGNRAYYHLAAYTDLGYEHKASFALFWQALNYFTQQGVRWAALGAGAGTVNAESGLTRFKRGWATHTRPAYFCGRILNLEAYRQLSTQAPKDASFFPAYRAA